MYTIGFLEDNECELSDAQVSISENVMDGVTVEFKEYPLEHREEQDLLEEIIHDVDENKIQALIVDFKLDTENDIITGQDIIAYMHENVPDFPVIILTNVIEASKESPCTDADKVYDKREFLNPEAEKATDLVNNILLNIQKYCSNRTSLEEKLDAALKEWNQREVDTKRDYSETLEKILKIEDALDRYKQTFRTAVDSSERWDELKKDFEMLKQYEDLLE